MSKHTKKKRTNLNDYLLQVAIEVQKNNPAVVVADLTYEALGHKYGYSPKYVQVAMSKLGLSLRGLKASLEAEKSKKKVKAKKKESQLAFKVVNTVRKTLSHTADELEQLLHKRKVG